MRISIRVKPGNKKPGIEPAADGVWIVRVREQPVDGKANKAVLQLLAKALDIAPSKLQLVSGESAKTKRIEFPDIADWLERLTAHG